MSTPEKNHQVIMFRSLDFLGYLLLLSMTVQKAG